MKKLWLVGLVAVILCNCSKENDGNSGRYRHYLIRMMFVRRWIILNL